MIDNIPETISAFLENTDDNNFTLLQKVQILGETEDEYLIVHSIESVPKERIRTDMLEALKDMYIERLKVGKNIPSNKRDGLKEVALDELKKISPELFI